MSTISVSRLKAHLSEELRRVEAGESIIILDHRREVATLQPIRPAKDDFIVREALVPYLNPRLEPITDIDPLPFLTEDRADRC